MRSLAYLYAQTGQLNAEIANLKATSEPMLDKEWERHLNLEQPSRKDIREFAQKENIPGVIANLELLEANPTKMYDYYSKQASLAAKTSLAILKAQYEGESEDFVEKAHAQQQQILKLAQDKNKTKGRS